MKKRFYRFLSILLAVSICLSCFIVTGFAAQENDNTVSIREEAVEGQEGLYKLVVSLKGFPGAKNVLIALAYNKNQVTPARSNGNALETPTGFMLNPIAEGSDDVASKSPVTVVESGDYVTFYTGIYVTTGSFDFESEADAFELYYKIVDTTQMNKASWRFATVEEVKALYKDNTGAALKVTDGSSPMLTYAYGPDTGCDTSGGMIELKGFTFTGSDKDKLTATTIAEPEGGLTLAVPEKNSSPATLELKVTNTGLAGEYTGTDTPTTTWSIDGQNDTGATIDESTGKLSITNTGNAGEITVKASTVAGGETVTDTATVKITKATSVVQSVTVTGGTTSLEVPVGDKTAETTFSATVEDQYGSGSAEGVTWSISPADKGVTVANGKVTVTSDAAEYVTDTTGKEFTVTAECGGKSGTATLTVKRAASEATTVTVTGADSIEVPANGSKTVDYTPTVTDQYGAVMTGQNVVWSIDPNNRTGISIDSSTGTLTVTSDAAANGAVTVTVKATVDSVFGETQTTVARAASVATTIDVTVPGSIPEIPALNQPAAEVSLTATVKDQYGAVMTDPTITWKLTEAPEGVTIDQNTGKVTIPAAAEAGTVKFTAACGSATKEGSFEIKRAASAATSVELSREDGKPVSGTDTLTIPASGSAEYSYTATVKDQYGAVMKKDVTFSLTNADTNVSISGGTVIVKSDATPNSTYTLTATVDGTDPAVKAVVTITVKDIEITWPTVTTSNTVYGHTWKEIVSIGEDGSASINGEKVEGDFTVKNGGSYPAAGATNYTIVFQSTDGAYNVEQSGTLSSAVAKKPVTVTVDDKTKTYGEANPALTFTVPEGALVGDDTQADLGVALTCTATETSPAGTPVAITGTSTSANYDVTVTAGTLTINKATITSVDDPNIWTAILANSDSNVSADALLDAVKDGRTSLSATYANGSTTVTADWTLTEGTWDRKGGSYTYTATLTPTDTTNFNSVEITKTLSVTVTAVKVTAIQTADGSAIPGSLTLSKNQVSEAKDLAALGIPAQVKPVYDQQEVTAADISAEWDQTLAAVQAVANSVTEDADGEITLTLTDAGIPEWATVAIDMPAVKLTITNKYVIPADHINFTDITTTYGTGYKDSLNATLTDEATYGKVTFTYTVNGSEELPDNAGTYQITATAENANYKGSKTVALTISRKPLADEMLTITGTYTYTGEAITPEYTVSDGELMTGDDYTVAVTDHVNAGEATVTVTAADDGNYSGEISKTFTIAARPMTDEGFEVSGLPGRMTYTGSEIKPLVNVTYNGKVLVQGTDYTLSYTDNTNAGTAAVTITGAGNFTGSISENFTIAPAAAAGTVTITGTNYEVDTELTASVSGMTDKPSYRWFRNDEAIESATGEKYTLAAEDAGAQITVQATFTGNYVGVLTSAAIEVGKTPLTGSVSLTNNNGTITATVTVTPDAENYDVVWLQDGVEVSRTPASSESNTYSYTTTAADRGHTITVKLVAKGGTYTGEIVSNGVAMAASAPAAPSVTATAGDGQVTVSWTVSDNGGAAVTQYQVWVDSETPITLDAATTSYTFTGLTNDTEYTFQVKAINSVGAGDAGSAKATPKEPQVPSGGGGGSSVTRYDVSAPDQVANGKLTVSPSRAARGSTVTITVTPDEGYELDTLTVTDGDGNELALNDKGNGKFTFTMPRSKVEIAASFKAAEEPSGFPFTDVTSGDWYYDAVVYAWENDLMTGTSATTFAPGMTTSRAMLATLLYRLDGAPDLSDENLGYPYGDVDADSWYGDGVYWARLHGVVTGVTSEIFDPNGDITREQMAAMLYRYAQYKGYDVTGSADLSGYADADSVSDWAGYAMAWAVDSGLISGVGNNTLNPQGSATRAEIATILMRFCQQFAQ